MVYAKDFFDLQLHFAGRVAQRSGWPLTRVLLECTNLYVRFGLGRDFDADHPTWRAYLAGLETASDAQAWTYGFYLTRANGSGFPPVQATFGCFSYAFVGDHRVRLHFQNLETDGGSSLGKHRSRQRRTELQALFEHLRETHSGSVQVIGASWLYNLLSYRCLFPPSYLETARVLTGRFQSMTLWGQFLDRHGRVKENVKHPFLACLEHQVNAEQFGECFPLQVLRLEAPVSVFYGHYGISTSGRFGSG